MPSSSTEPARDVAAARGEASFVLQELTGAPGRCGRSRRPPYPRRDTPERVVLHRDDAPPGDPASLVPTRDHVTAIWGWDEELQRSYHARAFTPGQWQIITADGAPAGILDVEHRGTEIYLGRISIHPDYQGRGIGSQLIRDLLRKAREQSRDLILDVLVVNQRAHALYRRLGLHDVSLHGETNIKVRMSTAPADPLDQP
jgi:ribosomal protein S18 acetylase RimI-like enzyme